MTWPNNADATKIESFIKGLAEVELLYLNRLIVERLKLIAQEKSTRAMSRFNLGEGLVGRFVLDPAANCQRIRPCLDGHLKLN